MADATKNQAAAPAAGGGNGGNQFITAPLTTTLNNPSNISLTTTDIELPVAFKGVNVSRSFFLSAFTRD